MFDGTDLSLAYGANYDPMMMPQAAPQGPPPPMVSSSQPPVMEPVVSKAAMSHATQPEQGYAPPPAMYAKQPAVIMPPTESFWERMGNKKVEVIKLVVLALVVLLGISMDRVTSHYLANYIGKSFLTDTQEFLVRLSYPITIILALWVIKAMA